MAGANSFDRRWREFVRTMGYRFVWELTLAEKAIFLKAISSRWWDPADQRFLPDDPDELMGLWQRAQAKVKRG